MSELVKIAGPNGKARTSVVFVHGLGGDLRATWRQGQGKWMFWPRWLAEDIDGLAVYCVGYEAPISRFSGTAMHLTDRGKNILELILADREFQQGKLILIGHSFGGLVIKQLLRSAESEAHERPEAASLIARVGKVAFLATPHAGSSLASWGDRVRIFIRPSAATACLLRNDPYLHDLNDWYRNFANHHKISHLVLTETIPVRIIGVVVAPDSSDPGLQRSRRVPIDANHFSICKPANRQSEIYVHIKQFVCEDLQSLGSTGQGGIVIASDGDETITTVEEGTVKGSSPEKLEDAELRRIAQELLSTGSPPSLLPLFPDASKRARQALEQFGQMRRTVSDVRSGPPDKQKATQIGELLKTDELHHLLLAPPGSGKTHALWHAALDMLAGGGLIPIFIPLGRLGTWNDVVRVVGAIANGVDVAVLLRDSRVCVFLDGWSEFASGYCTDERAQAMRVLSRTRVIANGRQGITFDAQFRIWHLDLPPVSLVREAIRTALPDSPPPGQALIELLRLPLALSLFILIGGSAATCGELLARLHEHLSHDLPERFRDVVAGAIASLTLSRQPRRYVRLENEIRERATRSGLAEPLALLQRLGTLQDRAGMVLPVHDLYWSWLSGLGLLGEDRIEVSVPHLATRECYELALEAGALPKPPMVAAACKSDVLLAALLSAHLDVEAGTDNYFFSRLKAMFADDRLPVRCRAALAAFRSLNSDLLQSALNVLTEVHAAKLYIAAFNDVLIPTNLFPNRGIIADWLGASGTDQLIDAIATRGDASWGKWFEQMAKSGKLPMPVAVAAALACEGCVPEWTVEHLPAVINSQI
jgi:pimeloyl-ACP methyl ester carboxylesterase